MRIMSIFSGKKGVAVMFVIVIILSLLLVFALYGPIKKVTSTSHKSIMAFGEEVCDESFRKVRVADVREDMEIYASRTRESGGTNELYSPKDVVRDYKMYKACVKDRVFSGQGEDHEAIVAAVELAYRNWAVDICRDYKQVENAAARKDLMQRYLELEDDHYKTMDLTSVQASDMLPPDCADAWRH